MPLLNADRTADRDDGLDRVGGDEGVTWVIVEEVGSGDWGIGGRAMTPQDVKQLAASAQV